MPRRKRNSSSSWNYKGDSLKKQWDFRAPRSRKEESSKILDENGIEIDRQRLELEAIDLGQADKLDQITPTVGAKKDLDYLEKFNYESQFKRQSKAKSLVDRGLDFVKTDTEGNELYQFASTRAYEGHWKVERDDDSIKEEVILEFTSPYTYKNRFYKSIDFIKFDPYKKIRIRIKCKRYFDYPEKILVAGGWYYPPMPFVPSFNLTYHPAPELINYPMNAPPRGTKASGWAGQKMIAKVPEPGDIPVNTMLGNFYAVRNATIPSNVGSIIGTWLDGSPLYYNQFLPNGYPYHPFGGIAYLPGIDNSSPPGTTSSFEVQSIPYPGAYISFKDYYRGTGKGKQPMFLQPYIVGDIPTNPLVKEFTLLEGDLDISGYFTGVQSKSLVFSSQSINYSGVLSSLIWFEANVVVELNTPIIEITLIDYREMLLYTQEDDPGFRTMQVSLL